MNHVLKDFNYTTNQNNLFVSVVNRLQFLEAHSPFTWHNTKFRGQIYNTTNYELNVSVAN